MDPTLIVLIITTSANLVLALVNHIKSSSCCGMRLDTYETATSK